MTGKTPNILTIPGELLTYIFSFITDWYPILFMVNKSFNAYTKLAVFQNYRKIKRYGKNAKRMRKLRALALDKISEECVEKYPNVILWELSKGYIFDHQLYYAMSLDVPHTKLGVKLLEHMKFISKYLIKLTIKKGTVKELEVALKKYRGNCDNLCEIAIRYGNLSNLRFLVTHGYKYNRNTGRFITQYRQFDILKWWIQNDLPCYKKTHDAAKELCVIPRNAIWVSSTKRQKI